MRDIINIKKTFIVKNKKYNFYLTANVGDKIKKFTSGWMFFKVENKTLSPLWQFDEWFLDEIIEHAKIAGNEISQEDENIGIWGVFETGEPVNLAYPLMCYIEAIGQEEANKKCIPIVEEWEKWFHKMRKLNLCNKRKENFTYCVMRWDTNKM